jgi:putative membrane protein
LQNIARPIWVHASEREGELGKQGLLAKAHRHKPHRRVCRCAGTQAEFEPFVHYEDLHNLVAHLDTFAKEAEDPEKHLNQKKSVWKVAGEFLGLPMAESHRRKFVKNPTKPLGNLPLEILTHLYKWWWPWLMRPGVHVHAMRC